jgi:hypothetical protein
MVWSGVNLIGIIPFIPGNRAKTRDGNNYAMQKIGLTIIIK